MQHHSLGTAIVLAIALTVASPAHTQVRADGNLVAPPLLVVKGAQIPVRTQSVAIQTEVTGGLARTTIDLVFRNPNARQLEGELEFPLQAGQRISAFALDVNGHMRDAVPVDKATGQAVFEAVERRRVDPGLLEQTAGNQFRLRIFPIPANGERRVRIVIDQSLQRERDHWILNLPLAFGRGVPSISLLVIAPGQGLAPTVGNGIGDSRFQRDGSGFSTRIDGRSAAIRSGLTLKFNAINKPQAFVEDVDGQRYGYVEVPLDGAADPRTMPRVIGLLWDSSASAKHRDIDSEFAVLDHYFAAVGNGEVRLTRLRDVAEKTQTFTVRNGDWSALRKALHDTVYDGASALDDWKPQADVQDYLLVSDGLSNYGVAREMPMLSASQRLYALDSAGADSDPVRLAAWADARGGRLVRWQGSAGVATAARELTMDWPHLLSMEGQGAGDLVSASRFPQGGILRIAARLNQPSAQIVLHLSIHGREQRVVVPVASDTPTSSQVASLWASYTVDALAAEPEFHREQIKRIGQQFGLVTGQTSLIVLENAADYARFGIAPPAELRGEVAQLVASDKRSDADAKRQHLDRIAAEFAAKIQWWNTAWPKGDVPRPVASGVKPTMRGREASPSPAPMESAPPPSPMVAAPPAMAMSVAPAMRGQASDAAEKAMGGNGSSSNTAQISIAMQPWKPDSPFARRLRAAKADQVYAIYLEERASHADSSAFYLDVADILFERGQRELGLRVLSNLAELHLENRQLLRVLGYRLMQANANALAVRIFEQVRDLAPEEPQSWRDLGLADAAAGRDQDAINNLYRVVSGAWDGRFPSVELIALGELDAIMARSHKPLDTHAIDRRFLRNLPMDLRVVLSWDSDNTDIDLWVTDPNGERTYYGSPHSYQGGWLSHDCTQGYGPEEFILRHAKPGKYKVEANFFGDHSQLITGATTLSLHLFTGFGTDKQKDQTVTMRLKDAKDTILVGTFDVK